MSKKIVLICIVILLLFSGALLWANQRKSVVKKKQKNELKQQSDKAVDQNKYKTVNVKSNEINFSFSVPDTWLAETRNAKGYQAMDEDEMREFLATSYSGDIKTNSQITSDYTDLPWSMLDKMTVEEMKKVFENKKTKYNYNVGFPNASISSGKPINAIWYSDYNNNQIDFYITDNIQVEKEAISFKEDEFYKNDPHLKPVLTKEKISGFDVVVVNYNLDIDENGKEFIGLGGSGGKTYYVYIGNSGKTLVIKKQAMGDKKYEDYFYHMIISMKFE